MVTQELFGKTHKFGNHPIASQLKLRLFSRLKTEENDKNDKNDKNDNTNKLFVPISYGFDVDQLQFSRQLLILKLFDAFGRVVGLAVRSLLNLKHVAFTDWFWELLWNYDDLERVSLSDKLSVFEWDTSFKQTADQMLQWMRHASSTQSNDADEEIAFDSIDASSNLSVSEIYKIIGASVKLLGRGKKQILNHRRLKKLQRFTSNQHVMTHLHAVMLEWLNMANYTKFYEFDQCIRAMRNGLFFILPKQLQQLLNATQFRLLVCGGDRVGDIENYYRIQDSSIQCLLRSDVKLASLPSPLSSVSSSMEHRIVAILESTASYMEPLTRQTLHIELFWKVLYSLNKSQLSKFIKFVSGQHAFPSFVTTHSSPTQMMQNVYTNAVQLQAPEKKLQASHIHMSADVLYDVECLSYLVKSYHCYGSMMHYHNVSNFAQKLHPVSSQDQTHLWIIDQCQITFVPQTSDMQKAPNQYLPEAHTCTCSLRLPSYHDITEKELKAKLLKAIEYCCTFDAFGSNKEFQVAKIVQKRNASFKDAITASLQRLFDK